jgi:transcriptional regulator with XRE-family HTH domain
MKTCQLLRAAVDRKGISKIDLAAKVGISRTALFKLLKGTSLPKLATLQSLVDALGVEESTAAKIRQAYESDRYASINTKRKAVKAAKEMFVANLLESNDWLVPADADAPAWHPDLWAKKGLDEYPVYAEMKILDHYSFLGRAKMAKELKPCGRLKSQAWVCVPMITVLDQQFNEECEPLDDLRIRVVTYDEFSQEWQRILNPEKLEKEAVEVLTH